MLRCGFDYKAPESLGQALNDLANRDNAMLLAGGTDLVPLIKSGLKKPTSLLDLQKILSLKSIALREEGLFIGAMATLSEISANPLVNSHVPALGMSARLVASPQIRNRATLGGNLFQERRCLYYNQSENWRKSLAPCFQVGGKVCHQAPKSTICRALYYSDLAPVLLSFDARAEYHDRDGLKVAAWEEGIPRHVTEGGQTFVLSGILIPTPPPGTWGKFFKYSLRAAFDFATINLALRFSPASAGRKEGPIVKIVVGAIGPEPVELKETGAFVIANASQIPVLGEEIKRRAQEEIRAKSTLIRETGVSVQTKKESFHVVSRALDELIRAMQTPLR